MGNNQIQVPVPIHSSAVVEHSDRQSEQIPCAATTTSLECVGTFYFTGYEAGQLAATDPDVLVGRGDTPEYIDGVIDTLLQRYEETLK